VDDTPFCYFDTASNNMLLLIKTFIWNGNQQSVMF
jgi:hypothetical protein